MSDLPDVLLEDRLRATFASLAASSNYAPPPDLSPPGRGPRSRRHTRALAAAVGALVLMLVIAALVALGNRDRDDPVRKVVPPVVDSLFPDVVSHQGPELFLSPQAVPDGYQLLFATGPDGPGRAGGGSPQWTAIQNWVKLDPAGTRPIGGFSLSWGPADLADANTELPGLSMQHQDALSAFGGGAEPITISGKPAIWAEYLQTVAWEEGDRIIAVSAFMDGPFGTWSEHLSREQLEAIAATVIPQGDRGYELRDAPLGYEYAGQAPGFVREGDNQRRLVYSDGNGHGFAIQLVDNTQNPPGMALAQSAARLVETRGQRAVLTNMLNGGDGSGCSQVDLFICTRQPGDTSHTYLQWLEPDSTRVTITATGLSEQEIFDLAANLREATSDEWQTIVDSTAGIPCAQTARCK